MDGQGTFFGDQHCPTNEGPANVRYPHGRVEHQGHSHLSGSLCTQGEKRRLRQVEADAVADIVFDVVAIARDVQ